MTMRSSLLFATSVELVSEHMDKDTKEYKYMFSGDHKLKNTLPGKMEGFYSELNLQHMS